MNPQDIYGSPSPFTRPNPVEDDDGLRLATNASASAQVIGPSGGGGVTVAYNGVEATNKTNGKRILPRTIVVTTIASGGSGTFKTGAGNKWTATGTFGTQVVTEDFVLTTTDGGDTVRGSQLWDDPMAVTISVPGQNNATAQYKVGVSDIGAPKDQVIRGFKAGSAGGIVAKGQDGKFEKVPCAAGVIENVLCERIIANNGTLSSDAVDITVYL